MSLINFWVTMIFFPIFFFFFLEFLIRFSIVFMRRTKLQEQVTCFLENWILINELCSEWYDPAGSKIRKSQNFMRGDRPFHSCGSLACVIQVDFATFFGSARATGILENKLLDWHVYSRSLSNSYVTLLWPVSKNTRISLFA